MKYRIFKSGTMSDPDYPWLVDEDVFWRSAHRTWADAMQAVGEALRTITVTLPPYQHRYSTEDIGKAFPVVVEDLLIGLARIRYVDGWDCVHLRPEELEPVALALLAIDKRNKEKK
ncbi:hypothetical protein [Corynebacterium vitaeruminis]|uniref:hypothetical protein n=1 Tax=Corynebacterium vitaeruminis TaxID=38305 RepID=UPI0023EF702C|nr:hypothetical protein [Corynebacterium vitaeruminis]